MIFRKIKFVAIVSLLLLSVNAKAQTEKIQEADKPHVAQQDFIKDSIDVYIKREMQRWNVPGVAISIVKDGKVVFMKGYGERNIDTKEKVDENTLFQIASNTKAYTGTAIALLQSQKRLKLDDKVKQHLPYFELSDKYSGEQATVRDLLCHRLGFQTFQGDFLHWDCNLSTKDLIVNLKNLQPVYPFRYRYGYTNMGFVAAGEIIKSVTDTSWNDFLKYRFFEPLKMTRTTTLLENLVADKNASKAYTVFDGKLIPLNYANIDNIGACASINSCVKDISNWIVMQLDSGKFEEKEIVPYSAIRETRKSQMIVGEPGNPAFPSKNFDTYGLGWELEDFEGVKVVSHNGGANGFVTNTTLVPQKDFGFTILTNTDANWFFIGLQQQLLDYIMNVSYKNHSESMYGMYSAKTKQENEELNKLRTIAKENNKADLPLAEFAGKYKNSFYGNAEIKLEAGKLTMYLEHHPKVTIALQPLSGFNFMATFSDITYGVQEFIFKQESGKVKSVRVKVNDFIDYMPYEFIKEN